LGGKNIKKGKGVRLFSLWFTQREVEEEEENFIYIRRDDISFFKY
jgi:hypothetical protein